MLSDISFVESGLVSCCGYVYSVQSQHTSNKINAFVVKSISFVHLIMFDSCLNVPALHNAKATTLM